MDEMIKRLTYKVVGALDAVNDVAEWTTASSQNESDNAYANGCIDTLERFLVWLEAEKKALQD